MFRLNEIPFHRVRIAEPFWERRRRVNREVSLQRQYEMCERTGRFAALRLTGEPRPHIFWDSDTAKWLEAACASCRVNPEERLMRQIGRVAELFRGAQRPDGYLNSYFSVADPGRRWKNLKANHELYCAGHFFEAAVAHRDLTGRDDLLSVACRYADYIGSVFGRGEGQIPGYCGHEEIELALVRLYRATSECRYLDLASYFVEERGRSPYYFLREREGLPVEFFAWDAPLDYFQAHAPVREQSAAVGHAVRAMYLYCAMADVARETGDASLLEACRRIWSDLSSSKLYVTGGIGSHWEKEAFSEPYFLPNDRAYCETCASVGLVFWSARMLRLTGESSFAEVLERSLYNAALAGVSLDGGSFFYSNPLASLGQHHRQSWFECACCPSNLSRLLATLGGYVYSETASQLWVHLYIGSEASFCHGVVRQSGEMPWEGRIRLEFNLDRDATFELVLRLPAWTHRWTLRCNGEETPATTRQGWLHLERLWKNGDIIELDFPMAILRLRSDPRVVANSGQVALQRGPFVYCVEDADFPAGCLDIALPREASLSAGLDAHGFGEEIASLTGEARSRPSPTGSLSFAAEPDASVPVPFRAVPYFAWDNRQPGAMRVWIPEASF